MQKIGPKHKMCRRVGEPLCGRPNCPSNKRPYPPGQHGRGRKRISEYQTRLVEKQKLRAIYGVSEAQMKRYYEKASNSMDVTGEELIRQLETRLDTVILRLGFALTTRQARQLVSHGHVKLDGKRINVPSARVKAGQTVELSAKAKNFISVREALEITPDPPGYLYRNKDDAQGVLSRLPGSRRDPAPGQGRRAPDRRVLLRPLALPALQVIRLAGRQPSAGGSIAARTNAITSRSRRFSEARPLSAPTTTFRTLASVSEPTTPV